MIRRAVVDQDEQCWEAMIEIYRDHVIGWCRRAGAPEDELDNLAADTWERFWRCYTPTKLADAGHGTAAVLTYLRMCARSVVLDDIRRRGRLTRLQEFEQDTDGSTVLPLDGHLEPADAAAFWKLIAGLLYDPREHLLLRLTYENGLRPAEVQRLYPAEFPTVACVYKTSRNMLDRMRRSTALSQWLGLSPQK